MPKRAAYAVAVPAATMNAARAANAPASAVRATQPSRSAHGRRRGTARAAFDATTV
jgi:hypothetical protein